MWTGPDQAVVDMQQSLTSELTTAPLDSSWTERARAVAPAVALAAWTLFVWIGRVRNIVADDSLSGSGLGLRLALALPFVILAAALTVTLLRFVSFARARGYRLSRQIATALAAFGIVVWLIRGSDILLESHEVGFKIVHTVLAVTTIGLGAHVLRWVAGTR